MKLPFSIAPKSEIVPVGDEKTGQLYFKKISGRTASERAVADKLDFEDAQVQLEFLKLAQKVSNTQNVPLEDALNLIMTVDTGSTILVDYVDDILKLLEKRSDTTKVKRKITTLLIQQRLAYPIVIHTKDNKCYKVEPLGFPLYAGDKVKVNGRILTVEVNSNQDTSEVFFTTEPEDVPIGTVGFLVDSNTNDFKFGTAEWSEKDTESLPEELLDAVYNFYLSESGALEDSEEKKEPLKKRSRSSQTTAIETQ